ncbi:hypothetical protein HPSJM_03405 [Helicobacter pylori SJM180]|nr:hypothetical protein HPSJM_03405 [Helicobacter pylori SJM180]
MSEKPTIKIVNKKGIRGRENKRFLYPTYPKILPKTEKSQSQNRQNPLENLKF